MNKIRSDEIDEFIKEMYDDTEKVEDDIKGTFL